MDHDPKTLGALAQRLVGSSNESALSTCQSAGKTDVETAVDRARILLGCYRRDDAADPETYAGAVAAVLAEYAPDIVRSVTDPRSGLPSKQQWLPSVKEVRDACEVIDGHKRRMAERAEREREQLEARRIEQEKAARKPTLDELKAKYGPQWGLKVEEENKQAKARQMATLQEANRRAFVAECKEAGISPDSSVSPSLAALMKRSKLGPNVSEG